MISFDASATVVSEIVSPLSDFIAAWVRTPSDFDVLYASVFRDIWGRKHRMVVSTGRDAHMLYTGFTITEPDGKLVRCHNRCGNQDRSHHVAGNHVIFVCRKCRSECRIGLTAADTSTVLGGRKLVKVPYPQEQAATEWRYMPRKDGKAPAQVPATSTSRKASAQVPSTSIPRKRAANKRRRTTEKTDPNASQMALATPTHTPAVTPLWGQAPGLGTVPAPATLTRQPHHDARLMVPPLTRSVSSPSQWPAQQIPSQSTTTISTVYPSVTPSDWEPTQSSSASWAEVFAEVAERRARHAQIRARLWASDPWSEWSQSQRTVTPTPASPADVSTPPQHERPVQVTRSRPTATPSVDSQSVTTVPSSSLQPMQLSRSTSTATPTPVSTAVALAPSLSERHVQPKPSRATRPRPVATPTPIPPAPVTSTSGERTTSTTTPMNTPSSVGSPTPIPAIQKRINLLPPRAPPVITRSHSEPQSGKRQKLADVELDVSTVLKTKRQKRR